MVYTVTLNPSLDYTMQLGSFSPGEVNRADNEAIFVGGKGINVSIVLKRLGVSTKALGFVAGFTGQEIVRMLEEAECAADFVELTQGLSRINVKLKAQTESEINGCGPRPTQPQLESLIARLEAIQDGDVLVLAGNVPKGMSHLTYHNMIQALHHKNIKVVVDTTGKALLELLPFSPFLVKPNHHELGELFGIQSPSEAQIRDCAKQLQKMGAKNILVSRAAKGAILLDETGSFHCAAAPKGKVVNSVGAGDSMVAGFLKGYLQTQCYQTAFCMGLAAGSASAFCAWLPECSDVMRLFQTM